MAYLLTGGNLIDGTGSAPRDNIALLVEGERIASIVDAAEAASVPAPPETVTIDLTGKTIMPGLIDCHDHLAHTTFDLMERAATPLSLWLLRIAENLRVTLHSGVTTVRDAGGLDVGFKMAVEEGLVSGPRLQLGLTILSRTGGIDDTRLRSGLDLDWRRLPGIPSPVCDGVEECRKRVREVLLAGADWVKCASTGGVSSRTLTALDPTLTLPELETIVDEAHLLGKRVFVHAYGGPGLADAVIAGVDSVEHGAALCRLPDTVARMAAQGTYLVPTFKVLALHRERGSPWAKRKSAELADDHRRSLAAAMRAGIPIAMGTDAGFYGYGHSAMELRLMVEAGMTPMEAIVASTKTASECLGLENELGTIARGKLADLIVVDGDPLRDVGLLDCPERIGFVMKGGVVHVDRLAEMEGA
jgi:imidazolonepropionase-like amidohydrolase